MSASTYSNGDYVNWYECSSIFHVQSQSHFLQFDLAVSNGLRVSGNIVLSSLPEVLRNAPLTGIEISADADSGSMSVCLLINFVPLATGDSALICRGGEISESKPFQET